ncbi:MAG: hypothetical protein LUG46_01205 [Erysipelotrichaceae bacterium]|nr:hypothetical protein [Erysipelotrichaceae bacterium]
MFKKLLYADMNAIINYHAQIINENIAKTSNIKTTHNDKLSLGIQVVNGQTNQTCEISKDIIDNPVIDINKFEKDLSQTNYYYDYTVKDEFDIKTMLRGSIIKFEATYFRPDEFDNIDILYQFLPMLLDQVKGNTPQETEIIKRLISNPKTNVPIYIEPTSNFEDRIGFGMLVSDNFFVDSEEFYDSYDEVVILSRLKKVQNVQMGEEKVVFDTLKDFFGISRSLRRKMSNINLGEFENLKIRKNYFEIEILAIYE